MALKFALIVVAFCIAQGFAMRPMMRIPGKEPCRKPISEFAEEIPHEFEETVHEIDEVRETVSMAAMDAYANGTDPEVIIACFREQKENYMRVGKQISGLIRNASKEMAEELGENFEKYWKRAEGPLKTIGVTMKTLPVRTWVFIKNQEFGKALEVMRESRKVVERNSRILGKLMAEMAQEFPESAKKAEEVAREIRTTARNGCKAIGEAFRKCVEEGGPKKPVEDEDDDEDNVEIDEVSEQ